MRKMLKEIKYFVYSLLWGLIGSIFTVSLLAGIYLIMQVFTRLPSTPSVRLETCLSFLALVFLIGVYLGAIKRTKDISEKMN